MINTAELKALNTRPDGSTIIQIVDLIVRQIDRGEMENAVLSRLHDGDKIRNCPKISQWLDLNLATIDGIALNPRIRRHLTDDLRKKKYQGNPNPYAGHCYVAAEAAYHLLNQLKPEGHLYIPRCMKIGDDTHWFLRNQLIHCIIDPTADQFDEIPDYSQSRGCGFLTKQPSKRAQELLRRIQTNAGFA